MEDYKNKAKAEIKENKKKIKLFKETFDIINYMFKDITPEQLDKAHKIKTKEFNDKFFKHGK